MPRPWGTSATWTWTPSNHDVGTWEIKVEVKSTGAAAVQSSRTVTHEVYLPPQATLDALTADMPSPQHVGSTITWTAQASGGEPPLVYAFQRRNAAGGEWISTREWSTDPAWTWTSSASHEATWEIRAEVKSAGALQSHASRTAIVTLSIPAALSSFAADKSSPQVQGSTITWTATASSGTVPLEFQFERRDGTTWTVVQPYSSANVYIWTPASADIGDHSVRVLVRSAGCPDAFDTTATTDMTIVASSSSWDVTAPNPVLCASSTLAPCLRALPHLSLPSTTSSDSLERHSLYSPELTLLAETSETSSAQKQIAYEYIWFGGQPLAQVETATSTISWYATDHLGTPIIATDGAAQIVWRAEYDPYGTIHAFRNGANKHHPLRLPGQEETRDATISYNIFRWYRAGWGRYTQADPLGPAGDANPYAYVYGNPISFEDPLGLYTIVGGSPAEKKAIGAAFALIKQQLAKDKCGDCKKYFASQPNLQDIDQWTQPGGPPYISTVAKPAGVSGGVFAYSQEGAPFSYAWLFKDAFFPSTKKLSPCDLASLILHEAGHLARQDTTDNEPSDFFKKCKIGCVNPGKFK